MKNCLIASVLISTLGGISLSLMAKEIELPSINVVDQFEGGASSIPGAVDIVSPEEMEMIQPASLQDALKIVPGVNLAMKRDMAQFLILGFGASVQIVVRRYSS